MRGRVEKQFPYVLTLDGGPGRLFYRGDEPWPFTLDLEFAGTRLHASGTADTRAGKTELFFGLGTENLAQIERLAQTRLPKVGVTSLAARMTARADSVTLGGIRGVMGASELAGHLEVAHGGERPRVTGELELSTLDLRPFLAGDGGKQSDTKPAGEAALEREPLDLGDLALVDADVRLSVNRWLGLPGDVRDAEFDLQLEDARLSAPLLATVAGVPVTGRLDLDGAAPVPAVALELSAERSPLGRLAEVFTGLPGIDGTLGRFELKLGGSGATLGALARDLELKLAVAGAKLSYGNVAGGRPVELALDALDVSIPRGKQLRGTGRGALAGERVTAELRGGDVPGMLRTASSPIDLQVRGAGATLALAGVLARPEATRGTDLKFRLEGRRAGDLARWLGTAPGANAPVAVQGHARVESDEWHLEDLRLKLGRSEIVVDAHRTGIGVRQAADHLRRRAEPARRRAGAGEPLPRRAADENRGHDRGADPPARHQPRRRGHRRRPGAGRVRARRAHERRAWPCACAAAAWSPRRSVRRSPACPSPARSRSICGAACRSSRWRWARRTSTSARCSGRCASPTISMRGWKRCGCRCSAAAAR